MTQKHEASEAEAARPKDSSTCSSVEPINYCSTCHVIDKFCADCHGMEMPHPEEFKTKTHPELVKTKLDKCDLCHNLKKTNYQFCNDCHHGTSVELDVRSQGHVADPAREGRLGQRRHGLPRQVPRPEVLRGLPHQAQAAPVVAQGRQVAARQAHRDQVRGPPRRRRRASTRSPPRSRSTAARSATAPAARTPSSARAATASRCRTPTPSRRTTCPVRKTPQLCANCHTFKELCSDCHHKGAKNGVPWQKQHPVAVAAGGTAQCFEKCHEDKQFCVTCHTKLKVVPASHKVEGLDAERSRSARPRSTALRTRRQTDSCDYCHGDGRRGSEVLQGCHKLADAAPRATSRTRTRPTSQPRSSPRRRARTATTQFFCDNCHHTGAVGDAAVAHVPPERRARRTAQSRASSATRRRSARTATCG